MRVPVLNRQVEQAKVTNVSIQSGLTPSQSAGIVENQIGGIRDLVNQSAKLYQDFQAENDKVRVIDAQNKAAELKLKLQLDDKDGYQNKKGVDVVSFNNGENGVNFVGYYQEQYAKGMGEIAESLSTPRQKTMFNDFISKDSINFQTGLQDYFIHQNDDYQQSVYSSAVENQISTMRNTPWDYVSVDKNREDIKASYYQLAKLGGKSAQEAENNYSSTMSKVHKENIDNFINIGNLSGAVAYKDRYGNEISTSDLVYTNQKIEQKLSDARVEQAVQAVTTGTQEYSNPVNGSAIANSNLATQLRETPTDQLKNIGYKDPRLDAYTVHAGAQRGMQWATPLILGIRLAGEKSNNQAVSPKGAKSVMQFMPATWGVFNKGGNRDIDNPADTIDAAYDFVDWIAKKYKTQDPMVIAAYYNGGHPAAQAVLNGKPPPASETRAYIDRMGEWYANGFAKYARQPEKTQEQARDEIWNNPNLTAKDKVKAQGEVDRYFKNQEDAKKDRQKQTYDNLYKGIATGSYSYEQIPANDIMSLDPSQIAGLKSVSKSTYQQDSIKTDPTVFSMIMLNKEDLFKGKPQSIVHQYADKLSPSDYKSVTQMYIDVNKPKVQTVNDKPKDKGYIISDSTVVSALIPYLNNIGISKRDTKDKGELLHFNAVKADMMATLKEAEVAKGSHLTWDEISRVTLKNINKNVERTKTPFIGSKSSAQTPMYSVVRSVKDIYPETLKKLQKQFADQKRDLANVTDSEYIAAYYAYMRRGY